MVVSRFAFVLALATSSAEAFVGPRPTTNVVPAVSRTIRTPSSKLFIDAQGWDSFKRSTDIPSGEVSREYRRTVYSHDDWVKHRSPNRFAYYLFAVFKSGVYKNMTREIIVATGAAVFVFLYNMAVGGYTDLTGIDHTGIIANEAFQKLALPLTPFTLASPSLGLFLVFRTNTSYKRWDEARKNWGMNINHTRDLVRMANAFYDDDGVSPEQRADDLNNVALCTWAFVRSMKRHLSPESEDEEAFQKELYDKLPRQQAERIILAAHRPNRALQDLSFAVDNLPMHFMRKNEIQRAITIFEDNLGSSERLLTSPVPVVYSREAARFLSAWLLFLPLALYEPFAGSWNHIGMVFAVSILSVFLFGIDELATQLEEPFTLLPMQAFCDKIYNWCMEIVSWQPGDYGRARKPKRPEHSFFVTIPGPGGFTPLQSNAEELKEPVPALVDGSESSMEPALVVSDSEFPEEAAPVVGDSKPLEDTGATQEDSEQVEEPVLVLTNGEPEESTPVAADVSPQPVNQAMEQTKRSSFRRAVRRLRSVPLPRLRRKKSAEDTESE